jgi:hypothetical protein
MRMKTKKSRICNVRWILRSIRRIGELVNMETNIMVNDDINDTNGKNFVIVRDLDIK